MKTLDDAMNVLLRVNGLVEQYALQIKRNQSGSTFLTNIKRQLPTLSGMLKAQFGMISDLVMATSLSSSRGARFARYQFRPAVRAPGRDRSAM